MSRKLVPQLRFPEFRDAGEWEEKSLSNLSACRLSNGIFNDPKKVGRGYKLINVSEMYIESSINEDSLSLIAISEDEFLKNKVENGDIFFTRSSLVKSGIAYSNIYLGYSDDVTFDGHLIRFRPNKEIVFPVFVNYLLKTEHVRNQFIARAKTATMTTIGQSDVEAVRLSIPYINEQEKIAECFASIDDRITLETQKLDALRLHKKGLMQQLFPAEGQTLPQLRFPEFRDADEWEENKLGDIAAIRSGTTPSRAKPEFYVKGSIPWVKTTDLNNSYIYTTEEKVTTLAKVKLNPEGSVLVAMYGGFNQIGRTGYLKIAAATNQAISVLNVREDKLTSLYLLIWLNAKIDYWKSFAISSRKDANITGADVAAFPITFPSLPEQQKIADCLTSLDELIILQAQKIDALKLHKKGLMQQLFPSIDEVSE
ncbi:restriction endonuclease subunit S [Leptolyngbya sp. AN03gr2]|uniref:restriction endonuclease subunit S n=1 Tax=unclassified Leptolyngbya TaxID=2650499 RepID=UPI003D313EE6